MQSLTDWLDRATGSLRRSEEPRSERDLADRLPREELVQSRGSPQGRRSRLVIRRVDPWTILKFSVLLYVSVYFVLLVAGVVLWSAATAAGVRGNIESFIGELIAAEDFTFNADQILRSSIIGGAILVLVGSLANVLMAVLYNLISDVVGGIGISVEERPPRRRRPARGVGGTGPRQGQRQGQNQGRSRGQRSYGGDRTGTARRSSEGEVTSDLGG